MGCAIDANPYESMPLKPDEHLWALRVCNKVMAILRDEQAKGKLPDFKMVEVNGMRLVDPHQARTRDLSLVTFPDSIAVHQD